MDLELKNNLHMCSPEEIWNDFMELYREGSRHLESIFGEQQLRNANGGFQMKMVFRVAGKDVRWGCNKKKLILLKAVDENSRPADVWHCAGIKCSS